MDVLSFDECGFCPCGLPYAAVGGVLSLEFFYLGSLLPCVFELRDVTSPGGMLPLVTARLWSLFDLFIARGRAICLLRTRKPSCLVRLPGFLCSRGCPLPRLEVCLMKWFRPLDLVVDAVEWFRGFAFFLRTCCGL